MVLPLPSGGRHLQFPHAANSLDFSISLDFSMTQSILFG